MDDKLMLEMAAGAAGIELEWVRPFVTMGDFAMVPHNAETGERWNPLCNDGDALRLAVKLKMELRMVEDWGFSSAYCDGLEQGYGYDHGDDPMEATRRAIVRAAAALAAPPQTDKGD